MFGIDSSESERRNQVAIYAFFHSGRSVYGWNLDEACAARFAEQFTESGFICLSYAEDKPNRLVRFIIEDSGPGIDENYRDSIFERFAKVDAFTQGTGLGLSIIRQIMELVDGNVYLDTSYAGGARFVVEWPQ